MPIATVHCPVSRTDVVRVTDLEGMTTRIVCPDYEDTAGTCRLKARVAQGGPLARLLERTQEGTLAAHGVRCDFA
jgi:hypothetical protein